MTGEIGLPPVYLKDQERRFPTPSDDVGSSPMSDHKFDPL
jgi:hypothetical protein